jgi:hypothetical protein
LSQSLEFRECGRFPDVWHFILNAAWKSMIKLMPECVVILTSNGCMLIKLNDVFGNALSRFHG